MFEKLLLAIGLALSLCANAWQLWYGQSYWRGVERAQWVQAIEDRNEQIRTLSGELSEAFIASEHARAAAKALALGHPIPQLPADIVALCSLPAPVRADLNKIGGL